LVRRSEALQGVRVEVLGILSRYEGAELNRIAPSPTEEQKQKKRTVDVLLKQDN